MTRAVRLIVAAGACAEMLACGSSTPPPSSPGASRNTLTFTVGAGPTNNYFNGAFTSVTVCAPGSTSNCQTIDGVLVDTGSSGFRVLKSVLTVPLRQQVASNGNALVECNQFLDGFTWGPVQVADLQIAGEQAGSAPIQVIGDPAFPTIPATCTNTGLTSEDTVDALGANGILGVGLFREDCGLGCAFTGSNNPGVYFQCASGSCTVASVQQSLQVQNPVALFSQDNNGVAITIPAIAPPGQVSASGTLVFGIGTQSNNALGGAKVLTTNANGDISTVFRGQTYDSFVDSGSNGYYFLDEGLTGLPTCADNKDFYCPTSAQTLSAVNRGTNGTTTTVTFTVDNADALPGTLAVLPTIGGTNAGSFDWGLPFFFGRTVFTAIENQSTPGGAGPYFAY